MEHLIRIVNEADRHTLDWLLGQVGCERVERAAWQLGRTRKPYVSAICRYLGVWPPLSVRHPVQTASVDHAVGDRYLSVIRQHLASRVRH
jgi:hypothetical protein